MADEGGRPQRALFALIAVNVAVFVAWTRVGPEGALWMRDQFTLSSAGVGSRPWTLLSYAFSHYDAEHLLFNGLALWIFGGIVQRVWGEGALGALYLGGAVGAGLAHVGWDLAIGAPVPALGASGAVMALSVAAAWTAPRTRILLFFVLPVPLWSLVPLYVGMDLLGLFGLGLAGVANAAHLGGIAAGAGWVLLQRRRLARVRRQPPRDRP